jgi:hypothetical protein
MTNKSHTESMRDLIQLLESQENLQEITPGSRRAFGAGLLGLAAGTKGSAASSPQGQGADTTQALSPQAAQANREFTAWVQQMRRSSEAYASISRREDPWDAQNINASVSIIENNLKEIEELWNNKDPRMPIDPNRDWITFMQHVSTNPVRPSTVLNRLAQTATSIQLLRSKLFRMAMDRLEQNRLDHDERMDREAIDRMNANRLRGMPFIPYPARPQR